MDPEDLEQLEKFRDQWKSEINTRKNHHAQSSKNETVKSEIPFPNVKASDSRQKEDKVSYFDDGGEQSVVNKCQEPNSQSGNLMKYYPFHIVENLLETSNKSTHSLETKQDISEKSYSERVSQKRKNIQEKKCSDKKRSKNMKLEDVFNDRIQTERCDERLLDKLIADIDEITEIPFFDISVPREVAVKIFQHLDLVELCQCAQVSKSWRSLAEDELLWCRICHRLGQEQIYTTREKRNWKQIVQHNVERRRTLISNWKNRIGKLSPLEHVKGKILTAVHTYGTNIVAGYTNGEVKLWDVVNEDSCVFQPSTTSLILDNVNEDGLLENIVTNVSTSDDLTVASYSHGNVDIWSLKNGTQPIQTFTPTTGNQYSSNICLSEDGTSLYVSYGSFIDVLHRHKNEDEFEMLSHHDSMKMVKHTKLYNSDDFQIPPVIYAHDFIVHMYRPVQEGTKYVDHVTEIHNLIGAPVEVIDFKTDQSVLGVGLGSYGAMVDGFRVKLYDIKTGKLLQTLQGHTWTISCMNMLHSPENELITGSGDRRLRIFDMRSYTPVQTLLGHGSKISCVQMDEWKVVSGAEDGFLCVWDRRMATKLWDLYNRHPVRYCYFNDKTLIAANISPNKFPVMDEFDGITHRKYRGTLVVYDFLEDLTSKDVPEICLSTYDQPDASRYNIDLAVPYDTLQY
ncbi:regulation of transcription factor catabolic process [Mactra antiquata]